MSLYIIEAIKTQVNNLLNQIKTHWPNTNVATKSNKWEASWSEQT